LAQLQDAHRKLLQDPNFVYVGTVRKDGTPHVVPTWIHVNGDLVELNTAEGRVWPTNARRDGRITLTVPNKDNPYEYVEIRGKVVEDTHEGADEHIDFLAKKYLGQDTYPFRRPDEQRLILRVAPEKIFYNNPG
jgi:PPOX class probable F420-dependent enzyme